MIRNFESVEVSIWKETVEPNENNNKRILSYIYRCLNTATNQFLSDTIFHEEIRLAEVISKELKELIDNNILSSTVINYKTFYHLPNKVDLIPFNNETSITDLKVNVWRGIKKEQLNHPSIKKGIMQIIKLLENYRFTASDITSIVKTHSNYDIHARYNIKDDCRANSEEKYFFSDPNEAPDILAIDYTKLAKKLLKDIKKHYNLTEVGKKFFEQDIKIFYWAARGDSLTQEQIALRVFNKKDRFRSVSLRLEKIKVSIKDAIKEAKIDEDEHLASAFFELVKKQFIIKG